MPTNVRCTADKHHREEVKPARPVHDFEQQCLRVLRCTALAFSKGPDGLRFNAGARSWLETMSSSSPSFDSGDFCRSCA